MKRILFVDDEVAILEGLRNALRGERKRWKMEFAAGAQPALEKLAAGSCDVIVTDMRMPGTDGIDLLKEVRRLHPRVARLVLSGYADLDRVAEATAVAHQLLTKPCEAALVRGAIERALRVQDLVASDTLRQLVCSCGSLPSAPSVYQALTAALGNPDTDAKRIAGIIERDVGMSSRALKFANSAYFGFSRPVSTIEAAVVRLGTNAVRHLALTFEVFRMWGAPSGAGFERLERHALLTARIARRLPSKKAIADLAFAAGLLHDAGLLLLMGSGGESFSAAIDRARSRGVPLHVAEAEVLGVSHAEVGAYLLALWDLPHDVVEPVALHHVRAPGEAGDDVVSIVALANLLAHEATGWTGVEGERVSLDGVPDIERWRELARGEAAAAA